MLEALHPYLQELNPILASSTTTRRRSPTSSRTASGSLHATLPPRATEGPRHYLRQIGVINARGVGVQHERPEYDRGNAYPAPNYLRALAPARHARGLDCKPTGGKEKPEATAGSPPCFVQPPLLWDGGTYSTLEKGEAPYREPPKGNAGSKEPTAPKE